MGALMTPAPITDSSKPKPMSNRVKVLKWVFLSIIVLFNPKLTPSRFQQFSCRDSFHFNNFLDVWMNKRAAASTWWFHFKSGFYWPYNRYSILESCNSSRLWLTTQRSIKSVTWISYAVILNCFGQITLWIVTNVFQTSLNMSELIARIHHYVIII